MLGPDRVQERLNGWTRWVAGVWLVAGLLSLIWFLVRVIPKPSRASYPCMRVAAPFASSFVVWILGLAGSVIAFRKARERIRESRFVLAAACLCVGVLAASLALLGARIPSASAWLTSVVSSTEPDASNDPIGVANGLNPGRVVWVYDPDATNWEGPGAGDGHWWEPGHTDQAVVDSMISRSIRWLAGKPTEGLAWEALFRHFNRVHSKGNAGYASGEKIAIKINLTTVNIINGSVDPDTYEKIGYLNGADTSSQMVLALLRQLVNVVGVAQADIAVGDTLACFPNQWHDYLAVEFPDVRYFDYIGDFGRTRVEHSEVPLYFSTPDATGAKTDYLPVSFADADYVINFAVLKGHSSGVTLCGKNPYGSLIRNPMGWERGVREDYYDLHLSLPNEMWSPGRGHYRAIVDLMGHEDLGGKTVLYLLDGLYGGYYAEGTPYKWNTSPFNGDWPSSLFVSQDPVAIDSVAYDFLLEEWPDVVSGGAGAPDSLLGGAQDYIHEAALAYDPPSGTFYDPEGDGTRLASLGVHEHWNNSTDKQYTRNLGTGSGIELITSDPPYTIELNLQEGWNLVSIPVEPVDPNRDAVFPPDVCTAVWEYNNPGGHAVPTEIHPKRGYWLKVSEAKPLAIKGARLSDTGVSLSIGWNLVGVVGPNSAACWQSAPPSPPSGAIWEYLPPYHVPSPDCQEGRGFWIKSSEDTTIWTGE